MTATPVPGSAAAAVQGPGPVRRRPRNPGAGLAWLFLAPAVLAVLVFFVVPMAAIIWRSFSEPELGVDHYVRVFSDGLTMTVLWRTFRTAVLITALTLLLAYPYAYAMSIAKPRLRTLLLALVMVPFWLSILTRTFAWVVILARGGPVNQFAQSLGLPEFTLLHSVAGATLGMVQVLLPFMVLPLYSAMVQIDRNLVTAAVSLGARRWTALRTVFIPLSLPGVVAGVTLLFVLSLGFYITPQLLGSPQDALIAQLIGIRVMQLRDFAGAGAVSLVLVLVCAVLLLLVSRVVRVSSLIGGVSR